MSSQPQIVQKSSSMVFFRPSKFPGSNLVGGNWPFPGKQSTRSVVWSCDWKIRIRGPDFTAQKAQPWWLPVVLSLVTRQCFRGAGLLSTCSVRREYSTFHLFTYYNRREMPPPRRHAVKTLTQLHFLLWTTSSCNLIRWDVDKEGWRWAARVRAARWLMVTPSTVFHLKPSPTFISEFFLAIAWSDTCAESNTQTKVKLLLPFVSHVIASHLTASFKY